MSGKIIFTISPARAGKSTFVKKYKNHPNTIVVNSDEIRLALHKNRYIGIAEPFVFAVTELILRTYYNMGYVVLFDETNTSIGSIRKILAIDNNAEAYFIDTPKEVCVERAYASNQSDLAEHGVIDRHFSNLNKLCEYAYKKENSGKFDIRFFYTPDPEWIYKAVEYIRQEIKNESNT